MKNDKTESAIREMQSQLFRAEVRKCQTPEQALAVLEKDGGYSPGKAILLMRDYKPELYNQWRKKPDTFKAVKNPGMERFNFIGR